MEDGHRRQAADRLRELGQRATAVRLDVIEVLDGADDHLLVPEVHRRVTTLRPAGRTSVSAVYRTIDRLAELGVVHGSPAAGGTAWGLALDEHSHATCDRCGRRVSLPADLVREAMSALDARTGIRTRTVDVHGVCNSCAATAATSTAATSTD